MTTATTPLYDIIIVGGGLIGNCAALALHHLPLRIAVIDACPKNSSWHGPDGRNIALMESSQRILSTVGIWPLLKPYAAPIQQVHISEQGHFGAARLHADKLQQAALGYVFEFNHLAAALNQAREQLTTIDDIDAAKVTDIQSRESLTTLSVEKDQRTFSLQAKLVIAADGSHSQLRTRLKIPTTTFDYRQCAIVAQVTLARSHHYTAYERLTSHGAMSMLPLRDETEVALVWTHEQQHADKLLKLDNAHFLEALQQQFGYRLGIFQTVGERAHLPLKRIQATQCYRNTTVLVGNALRTLHPVAAQGFNLGLRDIAMLAELIHEQWQSKQQVTSPSMLAHYQTCRRRDHQTTSYLTHSLAHTLLSQAWGLPLMRSFGLKLLSCTTPLHRIGLQYLKRIGSKASKLESKITLADTPPFYE